jgi:hypothetical protein
LTRDNETYNNSNLGSPHDRYQGLNKLLAKYGQEKVVFCPKCGSPSGRQLDPIEMSGVYLPALWHPLRCGNCGTVYSSKTGKTLIKPWTTVEYIIAAIAVILMVFYYHYSPNEFNSWWYLFLIVFILTVVTGIWFWIKRRLKQAKALEKH